ncbi:MAG: hypothetical protein EA420_01830 [Candidatus Competibacteraceae bacterium]|nr:MAG: hypothetical protein EA420_01830 [Candidatus Competibacteraceae bacterium]
MEILAEAAITEQFDGEARRLLAADYERIIEDVAACITHTLEVLVHDGYLDQSDGVFRFPSRLLRDWWLARFRDHHVPLRDRARTRG